MKRLIVLLALAFSAVACGGECGDGVLDAPNQEDVTEGCDDGGVAAGDGCDAACAIEDGFECVGAPSVCALSCSDGGLDSGEQCDDGNAAPGDGCSTDCQVENGFECSGEPSDCTPLCGNGTLNAGEICDDANNNFGDGCDGACFVEPGFECAGVPSVCDLSCGDATLDAGEGCDDGNTTAGDGCAVNCQIENGFECVGAPSQCARSCGDATLDAGEECDDGDTAGADGCDANCQIENGFECAGVPSTCTLSCGDATLDAGEECDDDNTVGGDGCDANCQVEGGFFCDNNPLPSVCTPLAGCPNGTLDANEECDDNNAVVGDGCDASCQIEQGFLCITPNGQPSVCQFVCGNGALDGSAGEQCDDDNNISGDGCDATCLIEPGFVCNGSPSVCTGCGNNIVEANEVCDGTDLPDGQGGQLDCGGFLFSAGTLGCAADCAQFDLAQCQVINGDGIRTPGIFIQGVGEQCDDGNLINGDGCSSVGLLENTTTVVVNANQAQLNNTTAVAATKTVFGAIGGVDLDADGAVDALFDFDQNGAVDGSVLLAVSTDRADICDEILLAGGFNGFLNAVFGGQIDGTIVLTFLQVPAATAFAANTFVGVTPFQSTPNSTSVDAGYIITNNGTIISDTTAGGPGTGNFGLQIFNFNAVTLAGTINFFTQNVIQSTQFIPQQTTINQPISVTVNGAPSCTLELLQ